MAGVFTHMLGAQVAGGGGGGPAVTLGNTAAPTGNSSSTADFAIGTAYQASQNFTATRFFIRGPSTSNQTHNFILCIYAAASATVWSGALLGRTNAVAGINVNELKEVALQSPVNIVSGNWYGLSVLAESPGGTIASGAGIIRAFADSYADGPAATAGATFNNGSVSYCVYISS